MREVTARSMQWRSRLEPSSEPFYKRPRNPSELNYVLNGENRWFVVEMAEWAVSLGNRYQYMLTDDNSIAVLAAMETSPAQTTMCQQSGSRRVIWHDNMHLNLTTLCVTVRQRRVGDTQTRTCARTHTHAHTLYADLAVTQFVLCRNGCRSSVPYQSQ